MAFLLIPVIILLAFSTFSSILLIAKGDNETYQMKFLGGTLLIFSLFFLTYGLWFEFELVLKYPHVLRSFNPFMFLAAPLFYFSIRNIVYGKSGFETSDWIHFLPALIHFLELMPLYALPAAEKLTIAKKVLSEEGGLILYADGLIPGVWVDLIRLVLISSYFIYSVYLVFKVSPGILEHWKQEKFANWVCGTLVFFGIIHLFFISQYIHNIQYIFTGVSFPMLRTILVFLMLLTILIYNFYNFFKWDLVMEPFGKIPVNATDQKYLIVDEGNFPAVKIQEISDPEEEGSELDLDVLREKLTKILEEEQVFLKQGLLVTDFAKELGISSRHLPEVLDKIYGKGFKDLINHYRIRYAKEKIESGYLDVFTLDSLGKEAGFKSRTTLFYAFKKEMNLSPTEYWKQFQEGPTHED
jgi:AraC-like DNA-binding protein